LSKPVVVFHQENTHGAQQLNRWRLVALGKPIISQYLREFLTAS
jgi:hypothetical protein